MGQSQARQPQVKGFASILRGLRKDLKSEDQSVWDAHELKWLRTTLYYSGQQFLRKNSYGLGYDVVPIGERDDVYVTNKLRFYSDNVTVKWAQSEAELTFRPADADDQHAAGIARQASLVVEHYARKFYTEQFLNNEAKLAQFCGNYARYFYYDPNAKGGSYESPIVQAQTVQLSPAIQNCPDCGYAEQLPADAPQSGQPCPQCGSQMQYTPGVSTEVQNVTGSQTIQTGDICCESVPFFQLRFDISRGLIDSPYLLRKRRCRIEEIQEAFPWVQISRKPPSDTMTQTLERLKRNTGTAGGGMAYGHRTDSGQRDNFVDFEQWWLAPCMLDYMIERDTQLMNGMVIPGGSSLKQTFPEGLYCAFVEGIEDPVDVRSECHKKFWVAGQFNPVPGRGLGDGIEDAVEPQRKFNMGDSLRYTHYRTTTAPTIVVNGRMLRGSGYLGKPGVTHVVKPNDLPEDGDVSRALNVVPMPSLPPDFLQYQEGLNGEMQLATKAVDFSNALPNVDNRTATGAQIGSTLAQSLHSPQLALRAEVDRASAFVILDLFKQFVPEQRYLQIKGRYGAVEGMWLRSADLEEVSFDIDIKGHSFMPRSGQDRRQDLQMALNLLGGPVGLAQAPRTLIEEIAETFDVDFGDESLVAARRLAQVRLDQMAQALPGILQQVQQALIANGGQMAPGVDPNVEIGTVLCNGLHPQVSAWENGHKDAIQFLQDWFCTDDGMNAPPALRAGAELLIAAYYSGMLEQQRIQLALQQSILGGPVEALVGQEAQQMILQQQQAQMKEQQANTNAQSGNQTQPNQPVVKSEQDKVKEEAAPNQNGGARHPYPQKKQ